MKTIFLISISLAVSCSSFTQTVELPYKELPKEPDTFTSGAVASRLIDGLGFRYYWATDGLRKSDLDYKPGSDARTSEETLVHIYELSTIIVNSTTGTPNTPQAATKPPTFEALRQQTLTNLKVASDRLRTASDAEMNNFKIVFRRDSGVREFPFWYQLNGPIADALWHVGQVVSLRRASGNPFSEKVNVFSGTVRE